MAAAASSAALRVCLFELFVSDQRSQIRTFNIAPTWTRILNANAVLTIGAWVRRDEYNYYPSPNLFNDLGPLQDRPCTWLTSRMWGA